jgi:hypothetical protein
MAWLCLWELWRAMRRNNSCRKTNSRQCSRRCRGRNRTRPLQQSTSNICRCHDWWYCMQHLGMNKPHRNTNSYNQSKIARTSCSQRILSQHMNSLLPASLFLSLILQASFVFSYFELLKITCMHESKKVPNLAETYVNVCTENGICHGWQSMVPVNMQCSRSRRNSL